MGNYPLLCGKLSIAPCTSFSEPPWAGQCSAGGTGIRFANHFGAIHSCFLAKINRGTWFQWAARWWAVCVCEIRRKKITQVHFHADGSLISHIITHVKAETQLRTKSWVWKAALQCVTPLNPGTAKYTCCCPRCTWFIHAGKTRAAVKKWSAALLAEGRHY